MKKVEELKSKNLKEEFVKRGFDLEGIYREEIKKHIGNAEELAMDSLLFDSPYKKLMKEAPSYIINEMLKELELVIQ